MPSSGPPASLSAVSGNNQTGSIQTADIVWTQKTETAVWPGGAGWFTLHYDPVSESTAFYTTVPGSTSIYSTDFYFYNSTNNTFAHLPGTGTLQDGCPLDTPTWPGNRHPDGMMAIDTKRNLLFMFGGVNQTCNPTVITDGSTTVTMSAGLTDPTWVGQSVSIGGTPYVYSAATAYTIAAVVDATHFTTTAPVPSSSGKPTIIAFPPPDTSPRQDMYYMTMNSNPLANTWHRLMPAHLPNGPTNSAGIEMATVYDPDDDVLFTYGYDGGAATHSNWMYCSTIGNPGGVLSSNQVLAGCIRPDDWIEVCPSSSLNCASTEEPPGWGFPGLVYDTVTKKVIQFAGGGPSNETWAYDIPTHLWTRKALLTTAPPLEDNTIPQPAMAYDTSTNRIYYHQTSGPLAPSDWRYDPILDTWTRLVSVGGGAVTPYPQVLAYDSKNNVLVGWSYGSTLWEGALNTSTVGGAPLANPFVVQVTDGSGVPVAGVTVTFAVTAGGGTLSRAQVVTDQSGQASSSLTVGTTPGANTVVVTSPSLPGRSVTFNATGASQ
jgi:hypothetical protein